MQPSYGVIHMHISIHPLTVCNFYQTNNNTFSPGCWCCRSATGAPQIQILLMYYQHLLRYHPFREPSPANQVL